ncbi:MAG: hypothetical protein RIC95_05225 [Vicingaceae bacterium]
MQEVDKIVQSLSVAHADCVKSLLAEDHAYSDISLEIFKAYRANCTADEIREELGLNLKAFKVFERIIYRNLLSFYQIEDKSVKDILLTTVFYAVYGGAAKNQKEKSEELEGLFHQLKQHKIEQVSPCLLEELLSIHKSTPLEAVYKHLHTKYKNQEKNNHRIFSQFEKLNQILANNHKTKSNFEKTIIRQYKVIRVLAEENSNPTSQAILEISKLMLVVICSQTQLLLEKSESIDGLFGRLRQLIEKQPFGFSKFYLENIYAQLEIIYLYKEDKAKQASEVLSSVNQTQLEAFNFNFPSKLIAKQIKESRQEESKPLLPSKYLEILPLGRRDFQNDPLHFGGIRLSCS